MSKQRDLLILTKNPNPDSEFVEKQIQSLDEILLYAESVEVFCIANEVIDINRYKIIHAPYLIRKIISDNVDPFVFVFNKN